MTLQEQFEEQNYERPVEPFSESENPEQWCQVLQWTEDYVNWLESKFTSDNSDYAVPPTATPKLPSLDAIYGSVHNKTPYEGVINVCETIKKLGNFA